MQIKVKGIINFSRNLILDILTGRLSDVKRCLLYTEVFFEFEEYIQRNMLLLLLQLVLLLLLLLPRPVVELLLLYQYYR
jgi:hypothetical protein